MELTICFQHTAKHNVYNDMLKKQPVSFQKQHRYKKVAKNISFTPTNPKKNSNFNNKKISSQKKLDFKKKIKIKTFNSEKRA